MMALISDIHGNFEALCSILEDINSKGIEDIVCLGDTAGYYSEINKCCDRLRNLKIPTLLGNHDYYITSAQKCNRSNSVNKCIQYQKNIISNENLQWLKSLRPSAQFGKINAVHGGWHDPLEEYVNPATIQWEHMKGNYFASGHTHIPSIISKNDKLYCNPGSVGQPRDGDARASYAIFDGYNFYILRVEYDFRITQYKMKNAGFSEYFYDNLSCGKRIGQAN